ncbi:GntR family transcriptional regulator [Actinophytocola sp.]|uniref:GntR family transcriptional regulator n=1 Tax=Actinophytocola sp. TaxID=1872138 RepID=UPI002ED69816
MINRYSGVPAYRQVADDIRARINSGEYGPGDKLPSEREMVDAYGVSRPTVRDAIGLLRSQGIVTAEHGKGVFVRRLPPVTRLSTERLSRASREANQAAFLGDAATGGFKATSATRVYFEPAVARIADVLGVEPGTEVCVRDRVMNRNDMPVQLAVSRLPRSLTTGTAIEQENPGPGGVYARLEEAGHRFAHFTETVSARMPTPDETSALRLATGTPVITVTRVAYTTTGAAVEVNDMVMVADRFELVYEIPAD